MGAQLDREGYLARWQDLHGGYDPRAGSVMLRGWLTVVYVMARPLARAGVHPDLVTLSSGGLAAAVVALSELGGRWWIAAGCAVAASGLLDGIDGCVAVLQDRASRWGYVLDSLVDRVSESLFLVAVVAVGCPVWLAVACGFGCFLLEYLRARAGNAGGDDVGRITMAERSTRVILLTLSILVSGILPGHADTVSALGPAVLLAMTAVAVVQLGIDVRRRLVSL
jgi:CDP-diacylglycerol--glycerol-3-phosphate 3-phosphatidyltransferase